MSLKTQKHSTDEISFTLEWEPSPVQALRTLGAFMLIGVLGPGFLIASLISSQPFFLLIGLVFTAVFALGALNGVLMLLRPQNIRLNIHSRQIWLRPSAWRPLEIRLSFEQIRGVQRTQSRFRPAIRFELHSGQAVTFWNAARLSFEELDELVKALNSDLTLSTSDSAPQELPLTFSCGNALLRHRIEIDETQVSVSSDSLIRQTRWMCLLSEYEGIQAVKKPLRHPHDFPLYQLVLRHGSDPRKSLELLQSPVRHETVQTKLKRFSALLKLPQLEKGAKKQTA